MRPKGSGISSARSRQPRSNPLMSFVVSVRCAACCGTPPNSLTASVPSVPSPLSAGEKVPGDWSSPAEGPSTSSSRTGAPSVVVEALEPSLLVPRPLRTIPSDAASWTGSLASCSPMLEVEAPPGCSPAWPGNSSKDRRPDAATAHVAAKLLMAWWPAATDKCCTNADVRSNSWQVAAPSRARLCMAISRAVSRPEDFRQSTSAAKSSRNSMCCVVSSSSALCCATQAGPSTSARKGGGPGESA
mmetsp:Transcript_37231/g.106921  ORF Transcript_37231/g.106921 Transcript_37231/m.106921 type:complete len:244 (+) Transcript_37231:201-932(+)